MNVEDPDPDAESNLQASVFAGGCADMVSQVALAAVTSTEPLSLLVAAVGPVLSRGLQFAVQRAKEFRKARREATGIAAAVAAGDQRDELLHRIANDPNLSGLVEGALDAGEMSTYPSRIRALGAALAAGVLADDADVIDVEQMVIDTLSRLERPHVRLLLFMTQFEEEDHQLAVHTSWTRTVLFNEQELLRPVLHRLLADLTAVGILDQATETDQISGRTYTAPVLRETWTVTDFGIECLRRLYLAGLNEDPIIQKERARP